MKPTYKDCLSAYVVGWTWCDDEKDPLEMSDLHYLKTDILDYWSVPRTKINYLTFNYFLRGALERYGEINDDRTCVLPYIEKFPCVHVDYVFEIIIRTTSYRFQKWMSFAGVNCTDFLSKIYRSKFEGFNRGPFYMKYLKLMGYTDRVPMALYKLEENAIAPVKNRASDEGYDLHLTSIHQQVSNNVTMYDTGVRLLPPAGWHFEIFPRSSLYKTGHILANGVGLIDEGYSGTIKICLIRVAGGAEIELPFKAVQAVLKKSIHYEMQETTDAVQETARGAGGFGSTG